MKYLYKCIPFLIFLLLCGCSYNDYTKTVLLPAQNLDSSVQKENSDGDWELKKMYQYQYTSTNISGWEEGPRTSIGWSGEDHTLYTLHGGSGEQVTVNKVDIRYGFYEEYASLGILYYNHIELSPDGRYVLYDIRDGAENVIRLYLYSISDQTTQTVAEIPDMEPAFSFRFIWSKDSTCLYYWYTLDPKLVETLEKDLAYKETNLEELTAYYYDLYKKKDETAPWLKIQSYDPASSQTSCIYSTQLEKSFSIYNFYALEIELFPSSDSSKLLIKVGSNLAPLVYDRATGSTQEISQNIFYEFGVSPEEFSYYGITNSTVYTRNINYESVMFLTEQDDTYIVSDYMATAAYTSLKLSGNKFLVSNDEKHMVDVETNESGESLILVYNYTPNIPGQATISGRQLLYQTTDDITSISITPDDRYIILWTEQRLSRDEAYNSADLNIDSGFDTNDPVTYPFAAAHPGSALSSLDTKDPVTYPQLYQYKITVLEL